MYIQYGVCQRPQPCQPVSYSSPTVPPGELVSKDSKLNPTKKNLINNDNAAHNYGSSGWPHMHIVKRLKARGCWSDTINSPTSKPS